MKPFSKSICLLGLVLAACQSEADTAKPSEAAGPPVASEPAAVPRDTTVEFPSLRIPTLDGKVYDLAEHRGRWVVVNFWATWCAPCIREMPELSAMDAQHEEIEVIGLAYEEIEADALREFLKQRPVVYPIAILDVYNPPADFATPRGLPMTYLIAPDGKLAKQFVGPINAHDVGLAIEAAGGPKLGN